MNYGTGKSARHPIIVRDENGAVLYGYKTAAWMREKIEKMSEAELKQPAPIIDVRPIAKEIYLAFMYLRFRDREVVKRWWPPDPRNLRPTNALLIALSEEITLTELDVYELLRMQSKYVSEKLAEGESIAKWL